MDTREWRKTHLNKRDLVWDDLLKMGWMRQIGLEYLPDMSWDGTQYTLSAVFA